MRLFRLLCFTINVQGDLRNTRNADNSAYIGSRHVRGIESEIYGASRSAFFNAELREGIRPWKRLGFQVVALSDGAVLTPMHSFG